jgi:hypothetical protein
MALSLPNAAHAGRPAVKVGPSRSARPGPVRVPGRPFSYGSLSVNRPMTGRQMVTAARAMAGAAEDPTIAAYRGQIQQNDTQTQNALGMVGSDYRQLGGLAKQGFADEGKIAGQLNTQLGNIGSQEQSQLQGIGQGAMGSLAKYSPTGVGPAGQALAQEVARQQGFAAQNEGAFRAAGANQGANYRGLAASQIGTFGLAGQEALRGIAQAGIMRNEPLSNRLAEAIAKRGEDVAAALPKIRQQEITNQIARAGLGIKQESAAASLGRTRADLQNANTNRIKAQTSAREQNPSIVGSSAWKRVQDVNNKNWSTNPNAVGSPAWGRVQTAKRSGTNGQVKPLSTLENNTWFSKLSTVEQLIKDGRQHGGTAAQITASLKDGSNPTKRTYDPTMIQAALEIEQYGAIQPQTAKVLQQMGLKIPGNVRVAQLPKTIGGLGSGAFSGITNLFH